MQRNTDDLERQSFKFARRGDDQRITTAIPESAGPRLATLRGCAFHSTRSPGSQTFLAADHFAAIMLAPAPGIKAAFASDTMQEFNAEIGMIVVNPANVDCRSIWTTPRENAVIALRPEQLFSLAAQEFDVGGIELQPPVFGLIDLKALHIAELLKAELVQGEAASELYIDTLITLFGIHLIRNYTSMTKQRVRIKGGLSASNASKVQEFLNENFTRKLAVAELAQICDLSPGHLIYAFSKTFGRTPHQYVLNLRLAFAKQLLVEGDMTIAEIAYLGGFSNQSHLTTTMNKYKRITPAQLRSRR